MWWIQMYKLWFIAKSSEYVGQYAHETAYFVNLQDKEYTSRLIRTYTDWCVHSIASVLKLHK